MKDLLIGMVVGVVTGYVLRKMEDDGKFRCLHANLHHLASKAKEEAMNLKDAGLDKVEYVADRAHQVAEQEGVSNIGIHGTQTTKTSADQRRYY